MESCDIYPSMTGLFYSAQCPPDSFMLSQMVIFPAIENMNNIPLHAYATRIASFFTMSKIWETTQISINRWMNKANFSKVIYF